MIAFKHGKDIDLLKLGCTSPNFPNNCLHHSTDAMFFYFTEGDKDLQEKIREDVDGGFSLVFTRKAVVDKTFLPKSTNECKSTVEVDIIQTYRCVNRCPPVCIRVGI